MAGRNSRAHAATNARRYRQVFDVATDGGAAGAIPLRGQALPAGWLIVDGFIDIHVAFDNITSALLGIAAIGNWNGLDGTNNLCCAAGGAGEALANFWNAAIPRSFSAATAVHGRDKTVLQIGASSALATLTLAGTTATTGRFSAFFDVVPPDGYAGGAV